MTVTIPQVEASRPEALAQSGAALGQSASGLATQIRAQRATLDTLRASWQGSASDAAIAKAAPTLEQMQRIQDAMTRAQSVLQDGGDQLAQTRTNILQTAGQLRQQGWQVAPDGTVSVRPGSALDQYAKLSPVNAMQVQQLAAANSTTVKTLLARFDSADRQIDRNVRNAVTGLDSPALKFGPGGIPAPDAPPDQGPRIPEGNDPKEVKRWWDSLSRAEKDQLLHDHPDKLGNLNGIPVEDRSTANKAVMQQDLDRVNNAAADHHVTVQEVTAHPQDYDLTPTDITRYTNATKVKDGLKYNSDRTGAPTFLQVYEPEKFGGQGRAAIAIGNPDTADNTAVVVPGTSHSVTEGWLRSDDAINVFNETSAADRSKSTAVVAWMGYNAPDSLTDPQVAQTGNAREGGSLLASDVNALEVTNKGDSHVTVIGHSYGSTTVADAAAGYGMHADDVVLIGSPGTDLAHSAADFHLPEGGHVYVG
ncbi:MAG: alpha/beta hydrolase, partial [Mycobacterium sp.]